MAIPNKSNIQSGSGDSDVLSGTEMNSFVLNTKCQIHTGEQVFKSFCEDHDMVLCEICDQYNHRYALYSIYEKSFLLAVFVH